MEDPVFGLLERFRPVGGGNVSLGGRRHMRLSLNVG